MSWRSASAVLLFAALTAIESCALRYHRENVASPAPVSKADPAVSVAPQGTSPPAPPITFESSVRPILAVKCAPCHEPGGKMYERLPFDDARVVSSHSEGILRRLKGEDREALERWLASLEPAGANVKGVSPR